MRGGKTYINNCNYDEKNKKLSINDNTSSKTDQNLSKDENISPWRRNNPFFWIFVVSCIPALADAGLYGFTSLAEAIGVLQELQNFDPTKDHGKVGGLVPIAFFAGVGVLALNIEENMKLIMSQKDFSLGKYLKKFRQHLINYPAQSVLISISSVTEGLIGFSNFLYVVDEINLIFDWSPYVLWPLGSSLAGMTSLQFILLNAEPLKKNLTAERFLIKDDDDKHNYEKAIIELWGKNAWQKFLTKLSAAIVNGSPILSAFTMICLASAETYAFTQMVFRWFDPQDEADRIAWVPAIFFGLNYFTTHFAVNGIEFKKFLATIIVDISNFFNDLFKVKGWKVTVNEKKEKIRNLKNLNFDLDLLKITALLLLKVFSKYFFKFAIAFAGLVTAMGAENDTLFTILFSRPQPVPQDDDYDYYMEKYAGMFKTVRLSFCFGFACLFLLETYAVESKAFGKLFEKSNPHKKSIIKKDNENNKQIKDHYFLEDFLIDCTAVSVVGSIKYLVDWWYIPTDVLPKDINYQQTLISSGILVLTGIGCFLTVNYLKPERGRDRNFVLKLRDEERKSNQPINFTQFENELYSGNNENDLVNFVNSENTQLMDQRLYNITQNFNTNVLRRIFGLAVISYGVTVGIELLTRYVFLESVPGEGESRLDTAQLASAIVGSLFAVSINRIGSWIPWETAIGIGTIGGTIKNTYNHVSHGIDSTRNFLTSGQSFFSSGLRSARRAIQASLTSNEETQLLNSNISTHYNN